VAVTKDMLLSELQDLLRLTAFEQTIANVRRVQAASTSIAEELKANADKARERQQLLAEAVRQTGGVPDVFGTALGKAGALLQTQVNQVQTLQGALLGDLALEHQLRERARYARTLAETLGYNQVIPVLDRLEVAHTATIEWLEQRLAEVGRTGTSALKATPVQQAVQAVRRTAGAPVALLAGGVNRASTLLRRGTSTAGSLAGSVADRALSTTQSTGQTLERAADTAAAKASDAAERVEEDVLDLTGLDEQHEPFPAYSRLSGDSVMRHVADTEDVEHLREILVYEQAHKARKGVLQALEARLEELRTSV
jgi:bacterioferritin (cytochrome b1)